MTDLELLIKRALKARGIKATQIGDLGFNYMTFYRKMKKPQSITFDYMEHLMHTLGYRMKIDIVDEYGKSIAGCISDPDFPIQSDEDREEARLKSLSRWNLKNTQDARNEELAKIEAKSADNKTK